MNMFFPMDLDLTLFSDHILQTGPRDDSDLIPARLGSMPGYISYGFILLQHAVN